MQSLLNYFQGADEPSLDEKAQVFREAHNKFIRAVARNKIYFGKDTCEIMDRLFFSSRDTYIGKTTLQEGSCTPHILGIFFLDTLLSL